MPWRQVSAMTERFQFIRDARRRLVTFTELCALYGISRVTGYTWLRRAEQRGLDYLQELSRRPHHCPHATPSVLNARLLEARRRAPRWGPRKLLALLRRQDARHGHEWPWPARSTVAELLRRNGLTRPRRRRTPRGHPGRPRTPMTAPNVIWTADYKGQFRGCHAGDALRELAALVPECVALPRLPVTFRGAPGQRLRRHPL